MVGAVLGAQQQQSAVVVVVVVEATAAGARVRARAEKKAGLESGNWRHIHAIDVTDPAQPTCGLHVECPSCAASIGVLSGHRSVYCLVTDPADPQSPTLWGADSLYMGYQALPALPIPRKKSESEGDWIRHLVCLDRGTYGHRSVTNTVGGRLFVYGLPSATCATQKLRVGGGHRSVTNWTSIEAPLVIDPSPTPWGPGSLWSALQSPAGLQQ
jgi:hypothetical protein